GAPPASALGCGARETLPAPPPSASLRGDPRAASPRPPRREGCEGGRTPSCWRAAEAARRPAARRPSLPAPRPTLPARHLPRGTRQARSGPICSLLNPEGAAARARSRRTPDREVAGFPRDPRRGDACRESERRPPLRRSAGGRGGGLPPLARRCFAGAAAPVALAAPRCDVFALARARPPRAREADQHDVPVLRRRAAVPRGSGARVGDFLGAGRSGRSAAPQVSRVGLAARVADGEAAGA